VCARAQASRIAVPYRVHELHGVPWLMPLPKRFAPAVVPAASGLRLDGRFGEVTNERAQGLTPCVCAAAARLGKSGR